MSNTNAGNSAYENSQDSTTPSAAMPPNSRNARKSQSISTKIEDVDRTLGVKAMEVADNLDTRISRFENLLSGRAENMTREIETRSQSAVDLITARTDSLAKEIDTRSL